MAIPAEDRARLRTLSELVESLMLDGQWRSVRAIRSAIGRGSETGLAARLRELRGRGYVVTKRKTSTPGLYQYRVKKAPRSGQLELL